ncbi:hypothetical protein Achl_4332 (plasmid) [Pseudarthrobacter chlorophenolicus A6]|uniref:Uncharacterized protein n=2 Tax=Pseudarthrobacter chlorophenolicus TaxID=85085 RepID=B8HIN6_PSECP|nr:hypothetical protein Achl_4332 [Pseudarthrobacter chlorophenolicus A6]SDQ15947.1 hypothetical protein SAMN04489738_0390 [Pseudarthrobacter chlorophenolicus]
MQTNTTGRPSDRPQPWKPPAETPHRPACATGKDIIAQTLVTHWPRPAVADGRTVVIDCMGTGCGFQSSHVDLVGDDAIWAEHAYHVADLLEAAGVAETAGVADAERLRLADKLDEEVAHRRTAGRFRWSDETNLGWTQAANHLRHPTATK